MLIGLILLIPLALAGLVLLFLGYRGRRIDDHLLCCKCRYDLSQLPATSDRCPECGANVRVSNATRHGNRQRRRSLIAAGWFVMIPALLIAAAGLYVAATGLPLIQYKPLFMLRRDIENPAPAIADPALAEISRRIATGKLRQRDVAPIIDDILTWQADPAHRWNLGWGNLIELSNGFGIISKSQWERYLSHAVGVRFLTSAKVHVGTNPEVMVQVQTGRFDSGPHPFAVPLMQLKVDWKLEIPGNIRQETTTIDAYFDDSTQKFLETSSFFSWSSIPPKLLAQGTHQMNITYDLHFTYVDGTMGTTHGTELLTFQVVSQSTPLINVRHDAAAVAAMHKAVAFSNDRTPPASTGEVSAIPLPTLQLPPQGGGFPTKDLVFHQFRPPFRGMFNLELVQGDVHWPFKNSFALTFTQDHFASNLLLDRDHAPPTLPHPGPAEIVMTPDPGMLNPHSTYPRDGATSPDYFGEVLRFPINLVTP